MACCAVERAYAFGGSRGNRGEPTTTIGDDTGTRPLDLVDRQFADLAASNRDVLEKAAVEEVKWQYMK